MLLKLLIIKVQVKIKYLISTIVEKYGEIVFIFRHPAWNPKLLCNAYLLPFTTPVFLLALRTCNSDQQKSLKITSCPSLAYYRPKQCKQNNNLQYLVNTRGPLITQVLIRSSVSFFLSFSRAPHPSRLCIGGARPTSPVSFTIFNQLCKSGGRGLGPAGLYGGHQAKCKQCHRQRQPLLLYTLLLRSRSERARSSLVYSKYTG